jgi:glycosyltransferase involved in cell wall biosynthesis
VTVRVQHFVPTWEPGAVGAHVVAMREALRAAGSEGDVYAEVVRGEMPIAARPIAEYARDARPGDVLCYQHAIGSTVADFVVARAEPLVVDYHNVTPSEFFEPWDRALADALEWGRRQLRPLARRSRLGLADSAYNEAELRAAGFAATAVVPVFFGARDAATVDRTRTDELRATKRGADWVFVGRLAPNKCQHDLVKVFALYRRFFDRGARLWLVGASASDRYGRAVERFVARAGLAGAVTLTGAVPDAALHAYYDAADVYVSRSRHEGFGVPLLEAMAHGVPVVALATTAVPETTGDAALLLDPDLPAIDVAATVARVQTDTALRTALVTRGRVRAQAFSHERTRAKLLDALAPVLPTGVAA